MDFIKKTPSQKLFDGFNVILLALFGFITFYPFWYVLIASFNTGRDFAKGGVYFFPRVFTLENYTKAFDNPQIMNAFSISVGRTVLGILLGLIVTALLAYALHVRSLPGRNFFFFYFFITTLIGGGMIPYYLLLRKLGLTKSFWIYVWPGLFNFMNTVLVRLYFDSLPPEMKESAAIDGANDVTILFRIYLPLSTPILATIALYIGVAQWNDWFTGAYYVSNTALYPAATLLRKILMEAASQTAIKPGQENTQMLETMKSATPQSLQMAFVMILTMPIVVVYPFLQKYYVKGVMVGSVKG